MLLLRGKINFTRRYYMKILLACSAGMSTSLLEKTMQDYMKAAGIEGMVVAHGSETAKAMIKDFDIVLLGPQVRFMLPQFKAIAGTKPVEVISPADYAMAKGENVVKTAMQILGK